MRLSWDKVGDRLISAVVWIFFGIPMVGVLVAAMWLLWLKPMLTGHF